MSFEKYSDAIRFTPIAKYSEKNFDKITYLNIGRNIFLKCEVYLLLYAFIRRHILCRHSIILILGCKILLFKWHLRLVCPHTRSFGRKTPVDACHLQYFIYIVGSYTFFFIFYSKMRETSSCALNINCYIKMAIKPSWCACARIY